MTLAARATPHEDIPFTGLATNLVGLFGFILVLGGVTLHMLGRRRKASMVAARDSK